MKVDKNRTRMYNLNRKVETPGFESLPLRHFAEGKMILRMRAMGASEGPFGDRSKFGVGTGLSSPSEPPPNNY